MGFLIIILTPKVLYFRNSTSLGKTIYDWNHRRTFLQQKAIKTFPACQLPSLSAFTESESSTTGQISEDCWQRQDTGVGYVGGEGDPRGVHQRGSSIGSSNQSTVMWHLHGRNTWTLLRSRNGRVKWVGRAGEGRQTDYDPAQSRAVRREGGQTGRVVPESTAQILSFVPGLPHFTAVSLCGWVGFFI